MPTSALVDRVAIVTGSTRGIGFATAARLAAAGARVVVVGRGAEAADAAVRRLGGPAWALACVGDVADPAFVTRAVDATTERFGGVDVLVNNAGIGIFQTVEAMTLDEWNRLLATNITAPFLWTKAVLPQLRRRGGGTVINVSSLASRSPFAGGAAYAATKSALNAFTEALLEEVRYDNIRVSLVVPGSVATSFSGRPAGGVEWKVAPEDVAEAVHDVLVQPSRVLTSRIEIRPSRPKRG